MHVTDCSVRAYWSFAMACKFKFPYAILQKSTLRLGGINKIPSYGITRDGLATPNLWVLALIVAISFRSFF